MQRNVVIFLSLAVGAGLFFFLRGSSGVSYAGGWREALDDARSEKKPILLNFGGPW